ncbi:4'-phosphopantetheinyl transferase superfamily protein [Fusobacterium necrophorum]|nr:4'-phosphopantetheinyl transferase superfamily protein [Fusobacterium necrophorum]AZW09885.1 4'-phosphopantetheinyl transferase superfamily protein [Fusobacterium necrophorum subsp. necrophorum]SDB02647.1 4'-phosphopantetheinyl transferase [Fusobacterium necrophorum]SQD08616.1 4'-phosphopantetheinyl transferase sfp [Fusobacterium necrophorum subsp. necrophorum]
MVNMKIYRIKISSTKELKKISEISKILNFYDILLVESKTDVFKINEFECFLNHQDIKKLYEYKSEVSKINFAVSRSILNKAFEKILNTTCEHIVALKSKYNKPYIKNKGEIKFNISHTDGYVLVGFSKREIGVDIEKVNYNFNIERILKNCFSSREIKNIGTDISTFYKYWTIKEAYLKCEGCGFTRNPKEVEIIYTDNNRIKIKDNVKSANKYLFVLSLSSKEYSASVCI